MRKGLQAVFGAIRVTRIIFLSGFSGGPLLFLAGYPFSSVLLAR